MESQIFGANISAARAPLAPSSAATDVDFIVELLPIDAALFVLVGEVGRHAFHHLGRQQDRVSGCGRAQVVADVCRVQSVARFADGVRRVPTLSVVVGFRAVEALLGGEGARAAATLGARAEPSRSQGLCCQTFRGHPWGGHTWFHHVRHLISRLCTHCRAREAVTDSVWNHTI